jgi:hypothetical protein
MTNDEREEEREFLSGLKARTGHDLAEWMTAIAAQGFADKNDTIDWLRSQGMPFARASWLERIHSNGGKPIYADAPPRTTPSPQRAVLGDQRAVPAPAQPPMSGADAAQLEKLLAAAKGYRPLYLLLETQIRRAIPGAVITPRTAYISVGAPKEFAAITLQATEVRLGLDLGEQPFDQRVQKARMKGTGAALTHMVVLTDARQMNEDLSMLLTAANKRVNS